MKLKGRVNHGRLIALLYRMFTVYLNEELPNLNLGLGQYNFLGELFVENGQSQEELTQKAYVNKTNTARALVILEEAGYVKRISDKNDKRIKRAFLQPKAYEIENEFWQILVNWSDIIGKNIPEKRLVELVKDFEKMAENASNYLKRY